MNIADAIASLFETLAQHLRRLVVYLAWYYYNNSNKCITHHDAIIRKALLRLVYLEEFVNIPNRNCWNEFYPHVDAPFVWTAYPDLRRLALFGYSYLDDRLTFEWLNAAPELRQVVIGHPRSSSTVNSIRVPQVTVICSFEDEDGCRVEPRHWRNGRVGVITVGLVSPGGTAFAGDGPAQCGSRKKIRVCTVLGITSMTGYQRTHSAESSGRDSRISRPCIDVRTEARMKPQARVHKLA